MIKNYKKFLEEITIKGNPGIPGQGDDSNDEDYLRDIENRASDKYNVSKLPDGNFRATNPDYNPYSIMRLVREVQYIIKDKKPELEDIATQIIMEEFGDILEGVELDIKFEDDGSKIGEMLGNQKRKVKEQEITDEVLKNKIHKAKLANNLIQGEAKNTKLILNSPESLEKLRIVLGNDFDRAMSLWNQITDIANQSDWIVPIKVKAKAMKEEPMGLAGGVKIDWKKYDPSKDNEYNINDDEEEEEEDNIQYTPVIKARGVDFPMLLHETVKGIMELIASIYQPKEGAESKEIEDAEIVKSNVTSFEDEVEDFRTGPEIASDLRDFINESPNANYSSIMRLYVYGKMLDPEYMNEKDFLELFRGILNKTQKARESVDKIVNEIVEELKSYEVGSVLGHEDDNEYDYDALGMENPIQNEEENLEDMTEKELLSLMDDALDTGNSERMKEIGDVLKRNYNESLTTKIYMDELNKINERLKYIKKK